MKNLELQVRGYTDLDAIKEHGSSVREPGLFRAYHNISGDEVVLKLWPLGLQAEDSAIRAIWREELRHASRFSGRRSSESLIVPIIEALDEPNFLAVVLQPEFRLPLAWHLANSTKQLSLPQKTRPTHWANLYRLAKALGILHEQGIVHRSISDWSVYTSFEGSSDFQLSGFESCFDIVSPSRLQLTSREPQVFSFRKDWIDFGLLAAELLGVSRSKQIDQVLADLRDSSLNTEERRFLRSLLKPSMVENTTGAAVVKSIEKLMARSESLSELGRGRYRLVVSLDRNARVASLLRGLGVIEPSASVEEVRYAISEDLASPVQTLRQRDGVVTLYGRQLVYTLRRFQGGWSAARCADAELIAGEPSVLTHSTSELLAPISIVSAAEANRQNKGLSIDWMAAGDGSSSNSTTNYIGHASENGLRLLLHVQALVSVCDVWPVSVQSQHKRRRGEFVIHVQPREESLDNELRPELMLDKLADSMRQDLSDQVGTSWKITSHRLLQIQGDDADNWEFLGFDLEKRSYTFRGPGVDLFQSDWYIRPAKGGTYTQLNRHAKWIDALANHPELSSVLSDPVNSQTAELRRVDVPDTHGLDSSKRSALKSILNSRPLSLIQGPPGVGKTTLVNALVGHRLQENPDEKFLVVAHSHESLNHLAEKITKTLAMKSGRRPLLVRAPERNTEVDAVEEIRLYEVSNTVADHFENSSLVGSLDETQVSTLFSDNKSPETYASGRNPNQSANDALMLRSANVVFATCNSYSIDHLVETNAQFDWVIVEESGKATGLDLIGALLCAPRLVLIGDQEQLPPFDERKWLERLNDPDRVKRILEATNGSIPKRIAFTGEIDSEFANCCLQAKRCFSLFGSLTADASAADGKEMILSPLTFQHRMHPAISSLVADCFYPGLQDAKSIDKIFGEDAPYQFVDELNLNEVGVSVIDLQWKQQKRGSRGTTDPYTNLEEVNQVVSIVEGIRVTKKGCSIAIISPFLKQVEAIKEHLSQQQLGSRDGSSLEVSTVDSFQGKEADVVIVSMVKNNHYTGTKAFGFLVDHRRFNVMLSRAKWKLIVVTSLAFWRAQIEWCRSNNVPHIPKFIEWADREASRHSHVEVIEIDD